MELKVYQQQVIQDLESFLEYTQHYNLVGEAFSKYWEDKIGPYNPLTGEGMRPYKNNVPGAANICIKVPTAGGKTFIACNALRTIFRAFPLEKPKAVVWLVPWSNLLDQTVKNLSDPDHPYRQKLDTLFNHRLEVYQKDDLLQGASFTPTVVQEQLTILVMSFASLRARRKEDRKVYQENGQLAQFAQQYKDSSHLLEDTDETALINVIRSLNPVVVVDESHNAESDLSVDMLQALNPSFVLDLTATPKDNSNIISLVPAIELKKEHMVKLPVIVYNHHDKTEVVSSALHLQQNLENLANEQLKQGGRYIRPIVLFQAQPRTSDDKTTFDKLKKELLQLGIPENQIKIKTANKDELKGVDLMATDCPVRFIITVNALKEGWDCPFAYILASLADKSSAVDVEQILGRVLRQPYVMKHSHPLLNVSYVLTASAKFNETLQNIVKGLQASGFSSNDYRHRDILPEVQQVETQEKTLEKAFFPEQFSGVPAEDEIDTSRIDYNPASSVPTAKPTVVAEIEQMAVQQVAEIERQIKNQAKSTTDNIFTEMGEKVQRFQMRMAYVEAAQQVQLPQFFLQIPASSIFDLETGSVLLNQEALLKGFRLSDEDTKIDFESLSADIYKVDLQEAKRNDFTPTYGKIEDLQVKDPIAAYILAKPKESQVKDISHQIMQLIGNMYPIAEHEIKTYVERILIKLSTDQLRDFLARKPNYTEKIKKKIRILADVYAEQRFNEQLKIGKITAIPNWKLPEVLIPGALGPPVASSLYEREGTMNNFEQSTIMDITSLNNILFWHRNLGRGKGFAINGFKSNHYPDFLLYTKSGKIVLVETKGDDRDNSDSEAKCRLGNQWAQQAGARYNYFMVFESKAIEGAYNLDRAKRLISQL